MSSVSDFISQLYFDLDPSQPCYQDAAGSNLAVTSEAVGNVPNQAGDTPVTQANTSQKPTLLVDELGWPYLFFDGSDDYLTNGTFHPASSGEQPFEVTVVQEMISAGAVYLGDGKHGRFAKLYGNAHQITFGVNFTSEDTAVGQVIVQNVVDGTNSQIYLNGLSAGSPGNAGSNGWFDGIFIGVRSSLSSFAENNLWRLLIHEVLSSTNRTGLYNYLNNLYSNPRPSVGIPPSFVHHHLQMMEAR